MGFLKEMPKYRKEIVASLLIFVGFFLYASRTIIIGASLLDMEIRVQQDFATTSRLITSHSAGYFVGAIAVTLLDRYCDDFMTMGLGTSAAGATIVVIPFLHNYYVMVLASFLNGIGNSMYDLKCHVALANLWGPKRVGNSIQILHMFFGFGALLCPAFVRVFLLPIPDEAMEDYENYIKIYKPEDVQITWPFLAFGGPSVVLGLCFVYYYFNNPYPSPSQHHENSDGTKSRKSIESSDLKDITRRPSHHSRWKIYLAVFWVGAMAHLAFALANMICSYVQAFGVKSSLHMDKKTAALVATVFWASFTISRALFVTLTMVLSEKIVIGGCLLMMVGSVILLFGFITTNPICLWLTAIWLGAGYSPLFPVAYSLIAQYFPLTSQQSSMIFLSGIIGDSLNTALSGTLIDEDPMLYAYHIGAISALYTVLSFTLPFLCRKMFGEKVQIDYDIELKGRARIGSIMMPPPSRANSTLSIH